MQNTQPDPSMQQTPSSSDSFVSAMSQSGKAAEVKPSEDSHSELLEDQNIFTLLGVTTADESQRESFLDELQQVIWEDFLEYDAKLLITQADHATLQEMLAKPGAETEAGQEDIVAYLEKKIPDLESIMLEKALELKAEMFRERLTSLRELYSEEPEKIKILAQAEQQMNDQQWRSAADTVASLT